MTTRLRLGTGVALPAQREPIVTAKALATLDQLSGGRFVLGTGFGWNVDEMAHHGVEYATRREHARESVLAMRALWENEEASFEGKYVQLLAELVVAQAGAAAAARSCIGGGAGPKIFQHIVEYAQGWIPIGGAGLGKSLPVLRAGGRRRRARSRRARDRPVRLAPRPRKARLLRGSRGHRVRVPAARGGP